MSKGSVHIVATIYPREGKVDRVIELLTDVAKFVEENEPKTLKYQLHRETNKKTGIDNLVMLESYTDMGAIKAHGSSKEYKQLQKTIQAEDLVTAPTKVVFLKPLSGFESRL